MFIRIAARRQIKTICVTKLADSFVQRFLVKNNQNDEHHQFYQSFSR